MKNLLKSPFLLGVLLLLASSFALLTNHAGFAQKLTTFAFWFFAIGLVIYLVEVFGVDKKRLRNEKN